MDRDGNPTLNPFINPDGEKDLYNSRQPADDVANYLEPWSKILENAGYPPEEAEAAALQVLPDILRYNRTKPPFYPNGRRPIEDIYSYRWAWLNYGKIPPTGLKPHADLLTDFPYLGQRARRELIATGEKVPKRSAETRGQLTPQEEQIARLASDGHTSPEIGAQLFLSARTVEWHLGKIFTKLGIGSRRELQAALASPRQQDQSA